MQAQIIQTETERSAPKDPNSVQDGEKKQKITISLAPLDSTDMHLVRVWRNDHRIWQWLPQNDLISDSEQMRWFDEQSRDHTVKMYKVVIGYTNDVETKVIPIGVGGFTSIDMMIRRAKFSLFIAPFYQALSVQQKAISCLLIHGFQNLGLHLIWGEVFEGNPALKIFEEIGFRHEGVRRDFYFRDGKYIDAHLISIKDDEWKQ